MNISNFTIWNHPHRYTSDVRHPSPICKNSLNVVQYLPNNVSNIISTAADILDTDVVSPVNAGNEIHLMLHKTTLNYSVS